MSCHSLINVGKGKEAYESVLVVYGEVFLDGSTDEGKGLMLEQGAFRFPCGSTGIDDRGDIIGANEKTPLFPRFQRVRGVFSVFQNAG